MVAKKKNSTKKSTQKMKKVGQSQQSRQNDNGDNLETLEIMQSLETVCISGGVEKHKSKMQERLLESSAVHKRKRGMQKSVHRVLEQEKKCRFTPEELEERRQYIRQTIVKGNQQLQEDRTSEWYADHSDEFWGCSSSEPFSSPLFIKTVDSDPLDSSKHVSFSDGMQVHLLQVDRVPPGRDNPIFDVKKTWITELMSKRPKKSSIKISVDKKCQEEQTDIGHHHFHTYLNIDECIPIDYSTLRVLYADAKSHIIVNTLFSYTNQEEYI